MQRFVVHAWQRRAEETLQRPVTTKRVRSAEAARCRGLDEVTTRQEYARPRSLGSSESRARPPGSGQPTAAGFSRAFEPLIRGHTQVDDQDEAFHREVSARSSLSASMPSRANGDRSDLGRGRECPVDVHHVQNNHPRRGADDSCGFMAAFRCARPRPGDRGSRHKIRWAWVVTVRRRIRRRCRGCADSVFCS